MLNGISFLEHRVSLPNYSKNTPNSNQYGPCGDYDFLPEFRASAIPDRLALINVGWMDGDHAIEVLVEEAISRVQTVTSYRTKPAQAILDRYEFARAGGWVAYGTSLDGQTGQVAYFKPIEPRQKAEFKGFGQTPKIKTIKYETPSGSQALPLLPWVDDQTARTIYDRYQVTPETGETFWQVVQRCSLPIAITEGLKKALALIAHGIPAIAIRGITQWHIKESEQLHQAIGDFATVGRRVSIFFDQDTKESAQKQVRNQILKLGAALEKQGCQVMVVLWDSAIGKGIDDALYAQGDGAQTWLDTLVRDAIDLATYKKDSRIIQALDRLKRLSQLSYPVERSTEGEYLPQLPGLQAGAIHALSAPMNAGKTTRIGADWVAQAKDRGWLTLVLSPTNATGQQTAFDWDLPHIHNYSTDTNSQTALWAEVLHRKGIVLCGESLHRLPDWVWSNPVLLVLDEGNQVIEGLTQGDTLGSRYSLILEKLTAAARHSIQTGAIVLSEDGLPDRAVNFAKTISGGEVLRVFTHRKQVHPWDCTVYRGQASGYRAKFLEAVQSENRLIYVTSSQREARRMERAIGRIGSARNVVRIDSETNQNGQFTEFFEQPDRWIETHQPDILILSPSAKSGISIQGGVSSENAYFKEVWGYFPALGTDTHSQLLGRYRPPVPRFIFCPDFILSSGDESLLTPRAIKRRLGLNAKVSGAVYGLADLLETHDDEQAEQMGTIQTAVMDYLAAAKATIGNQKLIAHLALVERLKGAGHNVTMAQAQKDKGIVTQWKAINEQIWREEAAAIAQAQVTDRHTIEWARRALDALDVSIETRVTAQKVLWRDDFPGMLFDCPEESYTALTRDYGAMARGVKLQVRAENLDGAKLDDAEVIQAIFSGNIKAIHRLPRNYIQALLLSQSGVLELLDGKTYHNADPRCQKVKAWAIEFGKEISYWLRLQIQETQTPIEICHKLLRKFGLERDKADRAGAIKTIGRKGRRGANKESFQIDLEYCPIRTRLVKALRSRLSKSVTSICNHKSDPIQINVTAPTALPPGWVAEDISNLRQVRTDCPELVPYLRETVPLEVLEMAWRVAG
jgi:hypothetical protein